MTVMAICRHLLSDSTARSGKPDSFQSLVSASHVWIDEPCRLQLGLDSFTNCSSVREILVRPKSILTSEIASLAKKVNAVAVSVADSIIKLAYLE
jgi:hypothetical protein